MLLTALIYAPSLSWSFGHDQNVFAEIGALILKGKLPYLDAWDIKPPNIFYVYAFAEWLFGQSELAIRLLDWLSIVVTGGLVFHLVSRHASPESNVSNRIGLLATFLFAITAFTLGLADTAQTESFSLLWLVAAAICVYREQSYARIFLAGVFLAIAGFFKTTNFVFFLPLAIELLSFPDNRTKRLLLFIAGCGVGSLAELGFMWSQGYLLEYLLIARSVFLGHASELAGSPVTVFAVFRIICVYLGAWLPIGTIGAVTIFSSRYRRIFAYNVSGRFAAFLLGLLLAGVIGVLVQQKGWGYHYVILLPGLLPLTALLSYPILAKVAHVISQRVPVHPCVVGVALTIFITVIPLSGARWLHVYYDSALALSNHPKYMTTLGKHNSMYYPPCTESLAEYLRKHVPPSESIFILGQEPGAYWKANRLPASRYIYTLLFTSPVMEQENFDELARSLSKAAPAVIVVERFDTLAFSGTAATSEGQLLTPKLLGVNTLLHDQYEFADIVCDKFLIYSRKPSLAGH